jgi:cysteinyl-tRNA synthetase
MALEPLHLYNSLTRKKEEFKPIDPHNVRVYTCGPTVYDYSHIGNFRSFLFADILIRTLKIRGYSTRYIRNITDVGHLTDDGDHGEDKVEKKSKSEGISAWAIAREYTKYFEEDAKKLNLLVPDKEPKATLHIPEQLAFIEELEKKDLTYTTNDGLYFDTKKFPDYGALVPSLQNLDVRELESRIGQMSDKKDIRDFALWKFSKEKSKRQMEWDSPWGVGFPGWHIECSAMSKKYLGFPFDLHTGGIDHLPIHHSNEIAQNDALYGKNQVHYWLHNEFVMVNNEKMSKSKNNFYRVADLEKHGHTPLAFRYYSLLVHYRNRLNFTWEGLSAAERSLVEIQREVRRLSAITKKEKGMFGLWRARQGKPEPYWHERFKNNLSDDLNTPLAVATLWDLVREETTKTMTER